MLDFYHLSTDIVLPDFFYTHKVVVVSQYISLRLANILGIELLAVLVIGVIV
jgi:hypothetical protein